MTQDDSNITQNRTMKMYCKQHTPVNTLTTTNNKNRYGRLLL